MTQKPFMNASTAGTPHRIGFHRILLCVDSTTVVAASAMLVRTLAGTGAQVQIVGVLENARAAIPLGPLADFNQNAAHARLLREVNARVAEACQLVNESGAAVFTKVVDLIADGGDAAHAIAHAAQTWEADLMILGARHHRGLVRWVERAAGAPDMRIGGCTILVVPQGGETSRSARPQRILVAVDGSPASMDALRTAIGLATEPARIKVLYVIDRATRVTEHVSQGLQDAFEDEGRVALSRSMAVLAGSLSADRIEYETYLARTDRTGDDVPTAILREATRWQADLLAMGTHGRRSVARWMLGSVSARVAEFARIPLILVRQRDGKPGV